MPDSVTCDNSCSLLGWAPNQASSIPLAPASGSNTNVVLPPCVGHFMQAYTKHRGTLEADIHNLGVQSNYLLANAHSRQQGLTRY